MNKPVNSVINRTMEELRQANAIYFEHFKKSWDNQTVPVELLHDFQRSANKRIHLIKKLNYLISEYEDHI